MCSGMFLGFGFSLHYHPVELLGFFGVTPCWENTGLWWLRLAGVSPNHGGHSSLVLVGLCSMVSWAVQAALLLPSLLGLRPPTMPRVLSCVFNLELFSFLVCSSTGQAGQGGDKAGWHRGHVAGLAALSEGTVGSRRGTITSPQPSCGTWAWRAREDCSH